MNARQNRPHSILCGRWTSFARMLPAGAAVGRFVGVDGRLRVRLAAVLIESPSSSGSMSCARSHAQCARGVGQRDIVDVGIGRFARCRVVLTELIARWSRRRPCSCACRCRSARRGPWCRPRSRARWRFRTGRAPARP